MFWVEENGGKWVMERLDISGRNVQFKPTQFPNPISNNFLFVKSKYSLDFTIKTFICQVLKHIKNPQKYPNMVDKLIKNVYNVWIIWGK
jgi:hypothetical protein